MTTRALPAAPNHRSSVALGSMFTYRPEAIAEYFRAASIYYSTRIDAYPGYVKSDATWRHAMDVCFRSLSHQEQMLADLEQVIESELVREYHEIESGLLLDGRDQTSDAELHWRLSRARELWLLMSGKERRAAFRFPATRFPWEQHLAQVRERLGHTALGPTQSRDRLSQYRDAVGHMLEARVVAFPDVPSDDAENAAMADVMYELLEPVDIEDISTGPHAFSSEVMEYRAISSWLLKQACDHEVPPNEVIHAALGRMRKLWWDMTHEDRRSADQFDGLLGQWAWQGIFNDVCAAISIKQESTS